MLCKQASSKPLSNISNDNSAALPIAVGRVSVVVSGANLIEKILIIKHDSQKRTRQSLSSRLAEGGVRFIKDCNRNGSGLIVLYKTVHPNKPYSVTAYTDLLPLKVNSSHFPASKRAIKFWSCSFLSIPATTTLSR